MATDALVFLVLAFAWAVGAAPVANYPVNAQLPPVARVGKAFNFTFAESTFVNDGVGLTYSITNAPKWLQLDSVHRLLHGTPNSEDVGATSFYLVAADQTGSTPMGVTLVISKAAGPQIGEPLLPQLAECGPTSSPATIFLYPERSFSLKFGSQTFINTDSRTLYYATSSNNSPLPSWVVFDPSLLKFDGTTPILHSLQPQAFSFNLVASDVAGFSATTARFDMVLAQHILAFKNSTLSLNFTRGQIFSTAPLINTLTLDGQGLNPKEITSVDVEKPSWLTIDNRTLSFTGTAPSDAPPQNVTITITDIYNDVTTLLINLELSQLFSEGLQGFYAIIGKDFSYTISRSLLTNPSAHLTVELGSISKWAFYNANSMTIQGHVPADTEPQTFSIQLIASEGSKTESRNLDFRVFGDGQGNSTYYTDTDATSGRDKPHLHRAGIIAIATVIPLAVILGIIPLGYCWHHRRQNQAVRDIRSQEKSPMQILSDEEASNSESTQGNPCDGFGPERNSVTFSLPPRLELEPLWETDFEHANEAATMDKSSKERKQDIPSRLVWPIDRNLGDASQAQESVRETRSVSQVSFPVSRTSTKQTAMAREPLKPIQQHRSLKRNSVMSRKSKRRSRRSSGISSVAAGLPVRLSGAGHGAGYIGSPAHAPWRVSWQGAHINFTGDENTIDTLAPLFPRPPPARVRNSLSNKSWGSGRMSSIQPIEAALFAQTDADSLETFIQERARNRNSDNPLFRARVSSRESTGVRALEKARRESSIAETAISEPPEREDGRQCLQVRPLSTARSSVYTDDFRVSTQTCQFSQTSHTNDLDASRVRGNRLVQRYTDAISQLPLFCSEGSLASLRHFESSNSSTAHSENMNDICDEQPSRESRDFSACRARRMSTLPSSMSGPTLATGEMPWNTFSTSDERQPTRPATSSFPERTLMSSISGDLAFV